MAITGFVFAMVGLIILPVPFGITATILGARARAQRARGLATAALVIGIINIVWGLIILFTLGRFF